MRLLARLLLLWIPLIPIGYIWGVPFFIDYLQTGVRESNYTECQNQVMAADLQFDNPDLYCHCLNEAIVLERSDLVTIVRSQQLPQRIRDALELQVDHCNETLGQPAAFDLPSFEAPAAPSREEKHNDDGSVELYL